MIDAYKRMMNIEEPPAPKPAKGFFTDTSLCIGCKACEVACKQWNQLPTDGFAMTGNSYDNTGTLGATTWRHVEFVEQAKANSNRQDQRWLMMSDVCKHCANAACLEDGMTPACAKSCPTASIQFGDVEELQQRARHRLAELKARGETKAELYGMPEGKEATEVGPLHAFFLLLDKPQTYNLHEVPR